VALVADLNWFLLIQLVSSTFASEKKPLIVFYCQSAAPLL
jgi:hypothetical protein